MRQDQTKEKTPDPSKDIKKGKAEQKAAEEIAEADEQGRQPEEKEDERRLELESMCKKVAGVLTGEILRKGVSSSCSVFASCRSRPRGFSWMLTVKCLSVNAACLMMRGIWVRTKSYEKMQAESFTHMSVFQKLFSVEYTYYH
jgi:hypothetical protein